jgi:hypothetical protein
MRQSYRRSSIQDDWGSLVLRHRVCSNVEFCELVISWSSCWGSDVSWNAMGYNVLTSFRGRLEHWRSLCCLPSNEIFRECIDVWDCLKRKVPVCWCHVEITTDSKTSFFLANVLTLYCVIWYKAEHSWLVYLPVQILVRSLNRVKGKGKVTPKQAYVALRGPGG